MANLVVIAGESGSGKSTSIKTLPPDKTFVINVYNKELPFKGSRKMYNKNKKNIFATTSYSQVIEVLKKISEEKKDIKYVVIDDIGGLLTMEFFARGTETGFTKFTEMAQKMQALLTYIRMNLRDDLNVAVMFHAKLQIIDGLTPTKVLKLSSKMIEERFYPPELVTVVLFTDVTYDDEDKPVYSFVTNRCRGYDQAKSPDGMFESIRIPNDLKLVFDTVEEYYN